MKFDIETDIDNMDRYMAGEDKVGVWRGSAWIAQTKMFPKVLVFTDTRAWETPERAEREVREAFAARLGEAIQPVKQ